MLDNYYIIEETVKGIEKDLSLKKYINYYGIANGQLGYYDLLKLLNGEKNFGRYQ